jgi:membrane-bound lytic murein transglycosylase MltF
LKIISQKTKIKVSRKGTVGSAAEKKTGHDQGMAAGGHQRSGCKMKSYNHSTKLDKKDFLNQVEKHRQQYGESEFSWEKPMDTEKTANIIWKHASDRWTGRLSDRAAGNVITAMVLVFIFFIPPAPAEIGHAFEKPYFAADYLLTRVNADGTEDPDPLHNNRFIKVLVASGKTSFFIDNGHFNGFEYEFLSAYEAFVNRVVDRYYRIKVLFIPVALKDMSYFLEKGYGDISAAGLPFAGYSGGQFSFSRPYIRNVDSIMVKERQKEKQPAVHSGGNITMVVRQGNTKLLDTLNRFIEKNRQGSHLGNILYNRYYRNSRWIKNPHLYHAMDPFPGVFKFMKLYGEQYQLNPLLLLAVAYKESKLDQTSTSPKGAVGIMQIMPGTAADPNVGIKNIHDLENNIHAGVKYLYHLKTQYFDHPAISREDRFFLTLAAYNAGPDRIMKMRRITRESGGNPDKWFFHVEKTAAQMIGKEVVEYVADVYKYFIAYQLQADLIKNRNTITQSLLQDTGYLFSAR